MDLSGAEDVAGTRQLVAGAEKLDPRADPHGHIRSAARSKEADPREIQNIPRLSEGGIEEQILSDAPDIRSGCRSR